jgi:hypothetical protein
VQAEIFGRFEPFRGIVPAGYAHDFVWTLTPSLGRPLLGSAGSGQKPAVHGPARRVRAKGPAPLSTGNQLADIAKRTELRKESWWRAAEAEPAIRITVIP